MRILLFILVVLLILVIFVVDNRDKEAMDDDAKYEIWKYNHHIKEI